MFRPLSSLFLLPLCVLPALADHLSPQYPYPVDLTSDKSTIPDAWKEITSTLQKHVDSNITLGGVYGLKDVAFSIGLFSLEDPSVSDFQFHHTSPEVKNAVNGTHEIDADSIYRVASITKVFTVLTGMLALKPTDWDLAVSDVFPEILDLAQKASGDNVVNTLAWDQITLRTLSAQISGLPTNPIGADSLIEYILTGTDPTKDGFPPYDPTDPYEQVACAETTNTSCYLPQIAHQYPNFLPWSSPLYSNNNFILLTALIENITATPMPELVKKHILTPLSLESTFSGIVPTTLYDRSVFLSPADWLVDFGFAVGSGGIASTLNDLGVFGSHILNSTLLSSFETRQWMKPTSHTARFEISIGRPWEIIRYTHASGATTDLYTKAGDSGTASSYLVLIPDYNAGFTILGGSSIPERNPLVGRLGDVVSNALLPALEAQALKNYPGKYKSSDGLNSSITLSLPSSDSAAPGLWIDEFIYNGTSVFDIFSFYYSPGARLVPSISEPEDGDAAERLVAFRIATATDKPNKDISKTLFSGTGISDSLVGDAGAFGGISMSLMLFEVDDEGFATTATSPAFRTEMKRCEE